MRIETNMLTITIMCQHYAEYINGTSFFYLQFARPISSSNLYFSLLYNKGASMLFEMGSNKAIASVSPLGFTTVDVICRLPRRKCDQLTQVALREPQRKSPHHIT